MAVFWLIAGIESDTVIGFREAKQACNLNPE